MNILPSHSFSISNNVGRINNNHRCNTQSPSSSSSSSTSSTTALNMMDVMEGLLSSQPQTMIGSIDIAGGFPSLGNFMDTGGIVTKEMER